jgi:hypothetical protein
MAVDPILITIPACKMPGHKWAMHFPEIADMSAKNHHDRTYIIKLFIRLYKPSDILVSAVTDNYVMLDGAPCWCFVIDGVVWVPNYEARYYEEELTARDDRYLDAEGNYLASRDDPDFAMTEYAYYRLMVKNPIYLPVFISGLAQAIHDAGLLNPQ